MSGNGVVVFDYDLWAAQFPELASSINSDQAALYFDFATLTVDNTGASFVLDLSKRTNILNLVTAHIAMLLAPISGPGGSMQQPSPLVGRLTQASEGSVSVSTDMAAPMAAAWFIQTRYGAMAWQFMAPFRTALYIANPYSWPAGGSPGYGAPGYFGSGFPGLFGGGFPWLR
jgi:hypothetical protein